MLLLTAKQDSKTCQCICLSVFVYLCMFYIVYVRLKSVRFARYFSCIFIGKYKKIVYESHIARERESLNLRFLMRHQCLITIETCARQKASNRLHRCSVWRGARSVMYNMNFVYFSVLFLLLLLLPIEFHRHARREREKNICILKISENKKRRLLGISFNYSQKNVRRVTKWIFILETSESVWCQPWAENV